MAEIEKIRPIYFELQGYLSQVPEVKGLNDPLYDSSIWMQYNQAVDQLNEVSGVDYSRFKVEPRTSKARRSSEGRLISPEYEFVNIVSYRQKISGLISRIHAEFFPKEAPPFGSTPSTIISQTQQQSQSVHIQMLLEVQSKIDQELPKFDEGTKERTFLQKVKGSLSSVKDATSLIALLLNIAKECGLSLEDLKGIFT